MTGKEFRATINAAIGGRRRHPTDDSQWRIRCGYYEPMPVEDVYKRTKKIAKKWKKTLGCIWSSDTMRGALQDWAARKDQLPIAVASITSTYHHGEYSEYGHRYLILLDPESKLWLIEPLAWQGYYPLTDTDTDFWDLYG